MKELNLYRVFEIMNILSEREQELSESAIYVSLLGNSSGYSNMSFESFLEYYSFKIEVYIITVFNDDKIQWEDYSTNDFSYIPIVLLSFSAEELTNWIETEIKLQLEAQELRKIAEKENIRQQIELLTKKLDKL